MCGVWAALLTSAVLAGGGAAEIPITLLGSPSRFRREGGPRTIEPCGVKERSDRRCGRLAGGWQFAADRPVAESLDLRGVVRDERVRREA
ncbi:hypothetical protein GCM10017674_66440 [Streptomyces gardneri]|uniref:Uncharacterized protein n=1 Tax=Streptomyces gardneri TaxID=66892 RepID=A0A4Y3RK82_9ACTN|nr:hypothetical protein SGA01_27180 [Streptomyces gardneri]GHH16478.1 hypothetical protein GCM10017674_66440 [Streptomyces gardneri]